MRSLIESLEETIRYWIDNGIHAAAYQSGDIANDTHALDLYDKVTQSAQYIEQSQDVINAAAENQQAIFDQLQEEYEEAKRAYEEYVEQACEARETEGEIKVIMGVFTALVSIATVVAVVATAGAAAPVVAAIGATAGSFSAIYGVSNVCEGVDDVRYAKAGDYLTKAYNPIRDTIFCGNQKLYDTWGNLSLTIASFAVPVGGAVKSVAGAGLKRAVFAGTKAAAKELGIDYVSDKISGAVTTTATNYLNLSAKESTILNVATSTVLGIAGDKGLDVAGKKFSVDVDDTAKYNKYWDEVANGTHNNYPKMTEENILQWEFGNSKLNEHLAIVCSYLNCELSLNF